MMPILQLILILIIGLLLFKAMEADEEGE